MNPLLGAHHEHSAYVVAYNVPNMDCGEGKFRPWLALVPLTILVLFFREPGQGLLEAALLCLGGGIAILMVMEWLHRRGR